MTVNTTSRAVWRGRKLLAEKQLTDPHHFSGNQWPVNISLWGKSWGPYKLGVGRWIGCVDLLRGAVPGWKGMTGAGACLFSSTTPILASVLQQVRIFQQGVPKRGARFTNSWQERKGIEMSCRCGSTRAILLPFVWHSSYIEKHQRPWNGEEQEEKEKTRKMKENQSLGKPDWSVEFWTISSGDSTNQRWHDPYWSENALWRLIPALEASGRINAGSGGKYAGCTCPLNDELMPEKSSQPTLYFSNFDWTG